MLIENNLITSYFQIVDKTFTHEFSECLPSLAVIMIINFHNEFLKAFTMKIHYESFLSLVL